MGLLSIHHYFKTHPLTKDNPWAAWKRFVKWQISSRIIKEPILLPFYGGTSLVVEPGMTGATGNYYCGLHEAEDMMFVLDLLKPGDLFVDVGANIGSYTILASGVSKARTLAFEPVPATYHRMMRNVLVNDLANSVEVVNAAVGSKAGVVKMTTGLDTMNRVVSDSNLPCVDVPVVTLDEQLAGRVPVCIKIDVEGFETEVLAGAKQTLDSPALQALLVELNGAGHAYGHADHAIHKRLLALGFKPHAYSVEKRSAVTLDTHRDCGNTLYLRQSA